MNLVFAGTPEFAVPSLRTLCDAGHRVVAVYTQPDRPAGRGRQVAHGPIKRFAIDHGLKVIQPASLKPESVVADLRALEPDAMIVVAYGLILPPAVLQIPRYGCLNVHASLLPRWRGAAPIQRAIEAGDSFTGITIMRMDAGLDTGDILDTAESPITQTDTAGTLHDRLAHLGGETLVRVLARLGKGPIVHRPQDSRHACYASKLSKDEARIDWRQSAKTLHCKIRAFNPWPVACTAWDSRILRLWEVATPGGAGGAGGVPGTVVAAGAEGICIQTGNGLLCVTRLQIEGGRACAAQAFVHGHPLTVGTVLGG
ncbi:MAG: methionyl-tRNA formyltransferase [Acidiferrobacterales bacterium]